MYRALIAGGNLFDAWRDAARPLALARIPPIEVEWIIDGDAAASPPGGSVESPPLPSTDGAPFSVPRTFVDLARMVAVHGDPERFALLYALLLKTLARRDAVLDRDDPLVRKAEAMAIEVQHARFSEAGDPAQAWEALRAEARACRRCPLYRNATATVFGEGPVDAALMLLGEQPGDQEDVQGRPFVGPAGQVLDRALGEAGIDRARVYITNAVKHFKFELRGRRRIHSKPDAGEIAACRWWIDRERALIRPRIVVALGATAAQSLLGRPVTISRTRGMPVMLDDGSQCHVTVHPSFLLRIDDPGRQEAEYRQFVTDLERARAAAGNAQD